LVGKTAMEGFEQWQIEQLAVEKIGKAALGFEPSNLKQPPKTLPDHKDRLSSSNALWFSSYEHARLQ